MNDDQTGSATGRSRRTLLSALGAGAAAGLAGCGTALGGGGPESLDRPEPIRDTPTTLVWEFPRGDGETAVQTYLDQRARVPGDAESADVRFRFGATVFSDGPYRHDRITLRLLAPANRTGNRIPADVYVHPLSGGFTSFRTYQEGQETVVSLSDLETTGTLHFEFLIHPLAAPTPETLAYDFEVRAEAKGRFERDAVASDRGQVPIVREDA